MESLGVESLNNRLLGYVEVFRVQVRGLGFKVHSFFSLPRV